ncbi:MAG: hypothetical protein IJB96_05480 [Lachnospira sp.]|nr:hypothetical protein [Lachnospira sp.]
MEEYKYKVAMYYCGGCTAYFRMKENCEGVLVPVKWTMFCQEEAIAMWDVVQGIGANINMEQYNDEIDVYEFMKRECKYFEKNVADKDAYWRQVICLHFYIREDDGYTISAMKKSVDGGGRFCGYIKRVHIPNNYSQEEFRCVTSELVKLARLYNESPAKVTVNREEFRKDESIGKHKFPWEISVYKGEKRLLIIPYLDHVSGAKQQPDRMIVLDENVSDIQIGEGVLSAIDIIKNSSRLVGITKGYELATKYKSWKTFSKRNVLVSIDYNEDGSFELCSKKCSKTDGIYDILGKRRELPSGVNAKELGENILMAYSDVCHV